MAAVLHQPRGARGVLGVLVIGSLPAGAAAPGLAAAMAPPGASPAEMGPLEPTPGIVFLAGTQPGPPAAGTQAGGAGSGSTSLLNGFAQDLMLAVLVLAVLGLMLPLGLQGQRWLRDLLRSRHQPGQGSPRGDSHGSGHQGTLLPRELPWNGNHHARLQDPAYLEQILQAERESSATEPMAPSNEHEQPILQDPEGRQGPGIGPGRS